MNRRRQVFINEGYALLERIPAIEVYLGRSLPPTDGENFISLLQGISHKQLQILRMGDLSGRRRAALNTAANLVRDRIDAICIPTVSNARLPFCETNGAPVRDYLARLSALMDNVRADDLEFFADPSS